MCVWDFTATLYWKTNNVRPFRSCRLCVVVLHCNSQNRTLKACPVHGLYLYTLTWRPVSEELAWRRCHRGGRAGGQAARSQGPGLGQEGRQPHRSALHCRWPGSLNNLLRVTTGHSTDSPAFNVSPGIAPRAYLSFHTTAFLFLLWSPRHSLWNHREFLIHAYLGVMLPVVSALSGSSFTISLNI